MPVVVEAHIASRRGAQSVTQVNGGDFDDVDRDEPSAQIIAAHRAAGCLQRCPAAAQERGRRAYTPPALGTVHAIAAEHGMVVAQEKIAARIGADILRHGGNAVDAAVATGFAMAVTYPRAGNIGGGGFMVIHLGRAQRGRRDRLSRDRAGRDHARHLPRRRRQARQRQIARFRARHRRARHGRGPGAGAGEIWLGQFHAGAAAEAGDRSGARRLRR